MQGKDHLNSQSPFSPRSMALVMVCCELVIQGLQIDFVDSSVSPSWYSSCTVLNSTKSSFGRFAWIIFLRCHLNIGGCYYMMVMLYAHQNPVPRSWAHARRAGKSSTLFPNGLFADPTMHEPRARWIEREQCHPVATCLWGISRNRRSMWACTERAGLGGSSASATSKHGSHAPYRRSWPTP